ncbi:MAG: glycine cleavage T C-terminal barrel domain-containing protein [Actinomycetota bacterium]
MLDLRAAEQAATDAVVGMVTRRDLLTVTGPDAGEYLHGQLSQTVTGLEVGASAWTLLLQPQGKVDAWLRLHRRAEDTYLLDLEPGFGAQVIERLKRFMLRVDLTVTSAEVTVLALRGPGAAAAGSTAAPGVLVLDAAWGDLAGVDLIAPDHPEDSDDPSGWLSADVPLGPEELLEVLRVRQGRPAMGTEFNEKTIPAAARVVDQSVDFTKGCYVGQELVARVDSRGNNTPTRLFGLRFDTPAGTHPPSPATGAELLADGDMAGTVTSTAVSPTDGMIGLGYLRRAVDVSAELTVIGADGESIGVRAVDLPVG